MISEIHPGTIASLVNGTHGTPFDLLGPHDVNDELVAVRAFWPRARQMTLVNERTGTRHEMQRLDDAGFFVAEVPGQRDKLRYHYEYKTDAQEDADDAVLLLRDPYAYTPYLTEYDQYLFSEGRHLNIYDKLGAHVQERDGVKGVYFAVWAPNAQRVSVIGDFNYWDGRVHPMLFHVESGIWEIFIPDLDEGTLYRYDLKSKLAGYYAQKTDPYGFYTELRPNNASIVVELDQYQWGDDAWMNRRAEQDVLSSPVNIYEVHLGSWRLDEDGNWLTYRELADQLVNYALEMGYTHLELMPIMEHPLDMSWGYQVTGYYAVTSRYGTPEDFMYFVDRCHQHGIGVILDWVPAHFPKDGHALSFFDGTHLFSHADPRQGEHPDWGTYIFNYGRSEVRNFLLANALFWLKIYHIDGLRVDAVSSMLYLDFGREGNQWIPNEYGGHENLEAISFLQEMNEIVHREVPGVMTIAEESTAWPMVSRPTYLGGLGFTLKWNMGWMHDVLEYMKQDPVYRRYHHNKLTFSLMYAFSENFVLSLSHDEVVHLKGSMIYKMAGDWWQKFASLRLLHGYQLTHPGKKLTFMGQEFGQWREWSEARSLDWDVLDWATHSGLQILVRDMNALYIQQPALYEHDFDPQGFQWIEPNDAEQSVFSYIRFADDRDDFLVIACNFTPIPRHNYRIGVPKEGHYVELINSDADVYGGSNVGNGGNLDTDAVFWHDFPQSLSLTVPPLGIVILKFVTEKTG
ncbi:MAG: 1,4-alpha-glucan branching protein GlgB [Anaerolineae bacterium]|nr:1,4-alpha-glucan branching protein GlgB [Anaerolineae bacterium]